MRRTLTALTALAVTLTLAGTAEAAADGQVEFYGGPPSNAARALPDQPGPGPNVVVILTDDQIKGTLDAMPNVRSMIRDQGVTLETGIIPTSLCCPSRTTLLSGRHSHTTGVYANEGPNGGWPTFHASGLEDQTIATELDNAGYRTGLFGKYLNGYALAEPAFVPPGWDEFRAIQAIGATESLGAGAYYNYRLHGTGIDRTYGDAPQDYSTDVVNDLAVDFIKATPADQPLMLYYAPYGGHAPYTAAPRHVGTWANEPLPPNVTQLTADRPSFWPNETLDPDQQKNLIRKQHESLRSVDQGVGRIVNALGDRASNTLFVYLSDNGLQFGSHGITGKNVPYTGSTEVPMMIRWDGQIAAGSTYSLPVTNIDLTATIADAADRAMTTEGVSFLAPDRPEGTLLEGIATDYPTPRPAYCGWRTDRWLFVEYQDTARRELYDYTNDPYELTNLAATKPDKLAELRAKAQNACTPTPPGFAW